MSNREDRTIMFSGKFHSLSPMEYGVFTMLILNAGEVVSREKLLKRRRSGTINAHQVTGGKSQ